MEHIKIKKILVPTDFSENSRKAFKYALAFARQFGASLTVLHVVEPVAYAAGQDYMVTEAQMLGLKLQEDSAQQLKDLVAREIEPGIPANSVVRLGSAWQEISLLAKESDVDLIIIGTHGYTGLRHVFLGSTAEKVVRHAPCPVLTVRMSEHEFV